MFRAALRRAAAARGLTAVARAGRRGALGQGALAAAGAIAVGGLGLPVARAETVASLARTWGEAGAENRPEEYNVAASGLGWYDVNRGQGREPVAGEMIRCHYTGTLEDGTVFDTSYGRRPLQFKIGARQVIAGWDEGILGDGGDLPPMKERAKRKLRIPPELAYGDRGAGGGIPPGATLYFDVELLEHRGPGPGPGKW